MIYILDMLSMFQYQNNKSTSTYNWQNRIRWIFLFRVLCHLTNHRQVFSYDTDDDDDDDEKSKWNDNITKQLN